MKFFFTIDALSAKGDKAWRLQSDMETWRTSTYSEAVQEGDAEVTQREKADNWTGKRLVKDKELGLIAKNRAGKFDFLMRGIFAHAVLHRLSAAPLPDKEQMLTEMRSLQPGTAWLLYLNTAGQFVSLDSNNSKIIGNLDIAVRGEIASSEDYIGPKAAENETMMNTIYHQFLAGWDEHLQTSQMSVFIPNAEKLKEESFYADRIQNWQPENL
ncbi:MAG: hypothetical protein GQ467_01670 [Mariprofundaceae bacterium]|nr:hypothetical protein [Mariprofundaceae bacterium]